MGAFEQTRIPRHECYMASVIHCSELQTSFVLMQEEED